MIHFDIERLKDDHRNTKLLAKLVKEENPEVDINEPETNIFMIDLTKYKYEASKFVEDCKKKNVLLFPYGKYIVRAIVCLNVNRDDIKEVAKVINEELKKIVNG